MFHASAYWKEHPCSKCVWGPLLNGCSAPLTTGGTPLLKPRFLPPGSLGRGRGRGQGLKKTLHIRPTRTQNFGTEGSNAIELEPEDEARTGKENLALNKAPLQGEQLHTAHDELQVPNWLHEEMKIQHASGAVIDGCRDGTKLTNITSGASPSLSNSPVNDASQEIEKSVAACSASSSPAFNNGDTRKRKRSVNFKPRGRNKVRNVATLKDGEKLDVIFYNNGPVGKNHENFSRHVGKLVRDPGMLPIRVHGWNEIDPPYLDKLWAAIVDKFKADGIEHRRKTIMSLARRYWTNWRGEMSQKLKKVSSLEEALKPEKVPKGLLWEDWEWLVLEHYTDPDFQIKSSKNSENRANLTMVSRTGSKPIRQIIYDELGGKDGKVPDLAEIFKATRKRKDGTLTEKDAVVYDTIVEESNNNPSMSQFDLVEKCFGVQDRDRVICFGYGTKPEDIRGPQPSKAELKAELLIKDRQISDLRGRMDNIELHEANHQKEINDMQEGHKRDIDKLEAKIKMLADLLLGEQSNTKAI